MAGLLPRCSQCPWRTPSRSWTGRAKETNGTTEGIGRARTYVHQSRGPNAESKRAILITKAVRQDWRASRGGLLGERRATSTRAAQPTSAHAPSRVSGHASSRRDGANASVDHHRWALRRRWRRLAGARRFTWPRWRRRLAQRLARSSGVRSERRAQQFLEVGHAGALRTAHAARLDQPLERAWLGLA